LPARLHQLPVVDELLDRRKSGSLSAFDHQGTDVSGSEVLPEDIGITIPIVVADARNLPFQP
jgi:hypothetical protein